MSESYAVGYEDKDLRLDLSPAQSVVMRIGVLAGVPENSHVLIRLVEARDVPGGDIE